MKLKRFGCLIVAVVAVIIIIPLVLEHAVFRNHIYSILTNGEWASFLGSYLGGVIGGLGTLLALYFTTKETRRIQSKTDKRVEDDRATAAKMDRKLFADSIAQSIAEYITDVSNYYRANQKQVRLNNECTGLKQMLNAKQSDIKMRYSDPERMFTEYEMAQIERLKQEETEIKDQLSQVEHELDRSNYSREKSTTIHYLLQIKLSKCKLGEPLLKQMNLLDSYSANTKIFPETFFTETDRLLLLTSEFIDAYVG